MKMRVIHIIGLIVALVFVVPAAGCSSESPQVSGSEEELQEGAYMKLRISSAPFTRSNPTGGENGDGLMPGIRHENEISDIALFFYSGADGLDSDGSTEFKHVCYFTDADLTFNEHGDVDYTFRLEKYVPVEGDRVAAAINMGRDVSEINTLGELRRYVVASAWSGAASPADYRRFTMSSAFSDDGLVNVTDYLGTVESPFTAVISVERTAARIDLRFDRSQISVDGSVRELVYSVGSSADVHLTNVVPVNVMQKGSWLMKHVTATAEAPGCFNTLAVCGAETVDAGGRPTNYVVEPTTVQKDAATATSRLQEWYGLTGADYLEANYADVFGNGAGNLSPWLGDVRLALADESDGYDMSMTVAYVNENTQEMAMHDRRFMTGLLFRGVYEPGVVYGSGAADVDVTYRCGQTFWRYVPTGSDMTEDRSLYFSSAEAAEDYRRAHPEDMATVTRYADGICYYHMWLRHANTDTDNMSRPHECCPMEYAIVRNNVYRVGVSFTGPGTPVPDIRDAETAVTRVFVRQWNFRRHPVIIM